MRLESKPISFFCSSSSVKLLFQMVHPDPRLQRFQNETVSFFDRICQSLSLKTKSLKIPLIAIIKSTNESYAMPKESERREKFLKLANVWSDDAILRIPVASPLSTTLWSFVGFINFVIIAARKLTVVPCCRYVLFLLLMSRFLGLD